MEHIRSWLPRKPKRFSRLLSGVEMHTVNIDTSYPGQPYVAPPVYQPTAYQPAAYQPLTYEPVTSQPIEFPPVNGSQSTLVQSESSNSVNQQLPRSVSPLGSPDTLRSPDTLSSAFESSARAVSPIGTSESFAAPLDYDRAHKTGPTTPLTGSTLAFQDSETSSLLPPEKSCHIPHIQKHGWKPATLKPTFLIWMLLTSGLFIYALEELRQKSESHGALAWTSLDGDFRTSEMFLYSWLPGILSIGYGFVWAWVEVDIQRMEPWLLMSRENGALAEHSLFIGYYGTFRPFCLVRALRWNHKHVLLSSMISIIVAAVVVPFTATAIKQGPVTLANNDAKVYKDQVVKSWSQQTNQIDQALLFSAASKVWYNSSYPAWTTAQYTLEPFTVNGIDISPTPDLYEGHLKVNVTKHWVDLVCSGAYHNGSSSHFYYQEGCYFKYDNIKDKRQEVRIIGWTGSGEEDTTSLYKMSRPHTKGGDSTCSYAVGKSLFFIYTKRKNGTETTDDAQFCTPQYWQATVEANISYPELKPISVGLPTEIEGLEGGTINTGALEALVSSYAVDKYTLREYLFSRPLVTTQHLSALNENMRSAASSDPLVGLVLSQNLNASFDAYLYEQSFIANAFDATYKSIYAIMMSNVWTKSPASIGPSDAVFIYTSQAIKVSNKWAWAAESGLGMVCVLTLILTVFLWLAPSNLTTDPSSMYAMTNLIVASPEFAELGEFSQCGHLSKEQLGNKFRGRRYRYRCGCQTASGFPGLERILQESDMESRKVMSEVPSTDFTPIVPKMLTRGATGAYIALVGLGLGLITGLLVMQRKHGGFGSSLSGIGSDLLFYYLPTHLGTILDPIFGMLAHSYALYQPFHNLLRPEYAKAAIFVEYGSAPSQFVLFRAFKARDWRLFMTCMVALLSTVLAFYLSIAFNEHSITRTKNSKTASTYLADWNTTASQELMFSDTYLEPAYMVYTNINEQMNLTSWATPQIYVPPIQYYHKDIKDYSKDWPGTEYTSLNTTALAIRVNRECSPFVRLNFSDLHYLNDPADPFSFNFTGDNNITQRVDKKCNSHYTPNMSVYTPDVYGNKVTGMTAAEGMAVLNAGSSRCPFEIIWWWASWGDYGTDDVGIYDGQAVACRPFLEQASNVNITVDPTGHLLNYSDADADWARYDNTTQEHEIWKLMEKMTVAYGKDAIHNFTISANVLGTIVKLSHPAWFDLNLLQPDLENATVSEIFGAWDSIFIQTVALNPDLLEKPGKDWVPEPRLAQMTQRKPRQVIGKISAYMMIGILSFDMVVFLWLLVKSMSCKLPRPADSIGSILVWTAYIRECLNSRQSEKKKFGMGRFTDKDGNSHYGIAEDKKFS